MLPDQAPSDLIDIFRVFVSGEAQTFDDIDTAQAYLRGQALTNHVTSLVFESAQVTIEEYALEIEAQEGGK